MLETAQPPLIPADRNSMITLRTMRRVLALDLGMDAEAVGRCLESVAGTDLWDSKEIPLDLALRIVETAEASYGVGVPA